MLPEMAKTPGSGCLISTRYCHVLKGFGHLLSNFYTHQCSFWCVCGAACSPVIVAYQLAMAPGHCILILGYFSGLCANGHTLLRVWLGLVVTCVSIYMCFSRRLLLGHGNRA